MAGSEKFEDDARRARSCPSDPATGMIPIFKSSSDHTCVFKGHPAPWLLTHVPLELVNGQESDKVEAAVPPRDVVVKTQSRLPLASHLPVRTRQFDIGLKV
jgi:hypothetical protein